MGRPPHRVPLLLGSPCRGDCKVCSPKITSCCMMLCDHAGWNTLAGCPLAEFHQAPEHLFIDDISCPLCHCKWPIPHVEWQVLVLYNRAQSRQAAVLPHSSKMQASMFIRAGVMLMKPCHSTELSGWAISNTAPSHLRGCMSLHQLRHQATCCNFGQI